MRASSSAVLPVHTKDVDGPASGSGRDATWPELWWRMYQAQLRRRPLRTKVRQTLYNVHGWHLTSAALTWPKCLHPGFSNACNSAPHLCAWAPRVACAAAALHTHPGQGSKPCLATARRRVPRLQALTSAVIFSASDVISQHLGEQPFSLPRNLLVAVRAQPRRPGMA